MKSKILSNLNLGVIVAIFSILQMSCNPKLIRSPEIENGISCYLETKKDTYKEGEEIQLYFVILNKSNEIIYIDNTPHGWYIEGKTIGGFNVIVRNESGKLLKPSNFRMPNFSGRYGITKIDTNKACKIRINLLDYADINKAGEYEVIISKELSIYINKRKRNRKYDSKNYKRYLNVNRQANQKITVVEIKE